MAKNNKLDTEARMTIKALAERGQSNRAIARLLGVHENAVRYHRRRLVAGAVDGRSRQRHLAERCSKTNGMCFGHETFLFEADPVSRRRHHYTMANQWVERYRRFSVVDRQRPVHNNPEFPNKAATARFGITT